MKSYRTPAVTMLIKTQGQNLGECCEWTTKWMNEPLNHKTMGNRRAPAQVQDKTCVGELEGLCHAIYTCKETTSP